MVESFFCCAAAIEVMAKRNMEIRDMYLRIDFIAFKVIQEPLGNNEREEILFFVDGSWGHEPWRYDTLTMPLKMPRFVSPRTGKRNLLDDVSCEQERWQQDVRTQTIEKIARQQSTQRNSLIASFLCG
jgi:hypothetical protein